MDDKQMEIKSLFQVIRGLTIPIMFKKEFIEEAFDFIPEDDDILISSYPKTGTIWTRYIVIQILTSGEYYPSDVYLGYNIIPFLEKDGISAMKSTDIRPQIYQTHLPYSVLKKNTNSKVIYVYRKPEDTLTSLYHMTKNLNISIEFDKFYEDYLSRNFPYGRYFEHIRSYLDHKQDDKILFVSYEKLVSNGKHEILKLAKFIGEKYYENLVNDESLMNKIMQRTSFDYMKKNIKHALPEESVEIYKQAGYSGMVSECNFFRKGIIGDGKRTLKEDQLNRLKQVAKEVLKGTHILSEWYEK